VCPAVVDLIKVGATRNLSVASIVIGVHESRSIQLRLALQGPVMNPYVIPVGSIVAGILVLLMPRLLNYIVALALIAYGLYELNKVHNFITI
jgi:hypothetical protein